MTAFTDLLANPYAAHIYLVELQPYNKNTSGLEWLYFSEAGFTTEPSDSPASTYFKPRLKQPLSFTQNLFSSGKLGGRSIPGYGSITLDNMDGALDGLRLSNYAYDGRRCIVRLGGEDMAYSDFGVIFDGTIETIEFGDAEVTIRLRDLQYKLDKPLLNALYAGSGGAEGGSSLANKPKPCLYGQVFNAEPVLVDEAKRIYQVHTAAINAFNAVKDQGIGISAGTSRATYAALDSNTPSASTYDYAITATGSYFRLGSTPNGVVTFDGQGDATGGYVSSVSNIINRMVTTLGGFSSGDLDAASFTALQSANNAAIGYYCKDVVNFQDALDQIAGSIGGWWGFSRDGKFTVGRVETPAGTPVQTFTDDHGFQRIPTVLPTWRVAFAYKKNYRPMTLQELATSFKPGEVNAASGIELLEQYRYSVASDSSVQTAHLQALDQTTPSLLASQAAADAEALRQLNMFKVARDVYQVRVRAVPFTLSQGNVVQLQLNRYGLNGGKLFTIIGMTETADNSIIELTLWG